ncbi:MAG: hypothetical protein ACOCXG_03185 [Nanoarchaeota archaeon]
MSEINWKREYTCLITDLRAIFLEKAQEPQERLDKLYNRLNKE